MLNEEKCFRIGIATSNRVSSKTVEQISNNLSNRLSAKVENFWMAESGYLVNLKNLMVDSLKSAKLDAIIFYNPGVESNLAWCAKELTVQDAQVMVYYFGSDNVPPIPALAGCEMLLPKYGLTPDSICDLVVVSLPEWQRILPQLDLDEVCSTPAD